MDDMNHEERNNHESEKDRKKSVARAGGRNKKSPQKVHVDVVQPRNENQSTNLIHQATEFIKKIIPLLILLTLLKGILGFLFFSSGRSNFVYYQSTIYESRTYNENGQLERIRKESVKSNIPNVINGRQEEKEQRSSTTMYGDYNEEEGGEEEEEIMDGRSRFIYDSTTRKALELDRELDRELNNAFKRSINSDLFGY